VQMNRISQALLFLFLALSDPCKASGHELE
jgi:hypothetical protein